MFWQKKNNDTRNVRRSVWKPEPKEGLLDRANKKNQSLEEFSKNKSSLNSQTRKGRKPQPITNQNLKHSNSINSKHVADITFDYKKRIAKLKLDQQNINRSGKKHFYKYTISTKNSDQIQEDPFASSYSDIANENISANSTSAQNNSNSSNNLKKNKSRKNIKEVNISPDELANFSEVPPTTFYKKLRLGAILLTLFFVLLTYFLDPWFWQIIRNYKKTIIADKDIPVVVLVRKDNLHKSGVTEELHFQALERLLNADAKVVGFFGSLADWLPISNDPLQIDRVNQLLIRFPNVVISANANALNQTNVILGNNLTEQNKISLPAENFANLPLLKITEKPEILWRALASINIGYVLSDEYYYQEVLAQTNNPKIITAKIAITQAIANVGQKTTDKIINGGLSFPLMLAVIANGQKPQDFKTARTITGNLLRSANVNLKINRYGQFAPAISFNQNFPQIVEWHDLLQARRDEFTRIFKNRTVLVGIDDRLAFLPQKLEDNKIVPFGLGELFNRGISSDKLIAIPAIIWQAQIFSSIIAGYGAPSPEIFINAYGSFIFIVLVNLVLWFTKNNFFKLMLNLFLILLGFLFQYTLAYTQISAILYAILILPITILATNARLKHQKIYSLWHEYIQKNIRQKAPTALDNTGVIEEINNSVDKNLNNLIIPGSPALTSANANVVSDFFAKQNSANVNQSLKEKIFDNENLREKLKTASQKQISDEKDQPVSIVALNPSIIQNIEKDVYADVQKSYQDETNPFVKASEQYPESENIAAQKVSTDKDANIKWEDSLNWDEKQRLVQNAVHNVINSPAKELNKPSSTPRVAETQLFNKELVENMENGGSQAVYIGRYLVVDLLGSGAMGKVFLGIDPHIERKVAIKTVPLPTEEIPGENEQIAKKFFREAQAAGRLTHPGIVTIYDAGLYKQSANNVSVYMAMEYLEGKDLSSFVAPDKLLPLVTVLSIVARVAEGLHFAHERGVIHRDIKPANIIFDSSQNTVKVTDFGIAHIHNSNRAMTQVLVGSPNYMSPEHLTGEALDGRSDLFSLGVTLYVLCCGATPFYAENVSRLMYSIINDPPREIRKFNPKIPDTVIQILDKSLNKDREMRYANGAGMAQDLLFALKELLNHHKN